MMELVDLLIRCMRFLPLCTSRFEVRCSQNTIVRAVCEGRPHAREDSSVIHQQVSWAHALIPVKNISETKLSYGNNTLATVAPLFKDLFFLFFNFFFFPPCLDDFGVNEHTSGRILEKSTLFRSDKGTLAALA